MSSPHGTSSGDHSGGLKGLDAALLQSQLVCLFYICVSCLITMYRGTVRVPFLGRARGRGRRGGTPRPLDLSPALTSAVGCRQSALRAPPGPLTPPSSRWHHPPLYARCRAPHPTRAQKAWHNDGWHLPMVIALAFSTYLKLKSVSDDGSHSA